MGYGSKVLSQIDFQLSKIVLLGIAGYKRFISRRVGRTCLFSPSCSEYARIIFANNNLSTGLRLTRIRLRECCGNYSLRTDANGEIELVSCFDKIYKKNNINPQLLQKITFPNIHV